MTAEQRKTDKITRELTKIEADLEPLQAKQRKLIALNDIIADFEANWGKAPATQKATSKAAKARKTSKKASKVNKGRQQQTETPVEQLIAEIEQEQPQIGSDDIITETGLEQQVASETDTLGVDFTKPTELA